MEILSQDTLRLLKDENFRKTLQEVLDNAQAGDQTVTIKKGDKQEPTKLTLRLST